MEIGMIGLGRMGSNMTQRLINMHRLTRKASWQRSRQIWRQKLWQPPQTAGKNWMFWRPPQSCLRNFGHCYRDFYYARQPRIVCQALEDIPGSGIDENLWPGWNYLQSFSSMPIRSICRILYLLNSVYFIVIDAKMKLTLQTLKDV